jgi:hypothetical protein
MAQQSKLVPSGISAVAALAIGGDTATGIVAAGATQATATPLPATNNYIATAAASTGVILPAGSAADAVLVYNGGANAVLVYPPVGANLNNGAVNAGLALPVGKAGVYTYASATFIVSLLSA